MIKKLRWLLIIPVLILAFFGFMFWKYSGSLTQEELNDKFIKVNPLDLSQIKGFSKYRSCMGHDYRAPTIQTGEKEKSPRSMKHYIIVKDDLRGKNGIVKAIAPFDGEISHIELKEPDSQPYDRQVWLSLNRLSNIKNPRLWNFIFMHITLKEGFKEGSKFKAGEIIGTAYLTRGEDNATGNFDMAVKFTRPGKLPEVDLPFVHFADNVLREYEKFGVSLADTAISEQFRDQNPCPTTNESWGGDVFFPATSDPKDYLYLK